MNVASENTMNTPANSINQIIEYPEGLGEFLLNWDQSYQKKIKEIDLFDCQKTALWIPNQKKHFIKMFYHIRGHFHVLLWHLGNFANSNNEKEMILYNIAEEFGGSAQSHEGLYFNFASSFGIDLTSELIFENSNLPFVKKFNRGHLEWFLEHDWDHKMSAFSAYERLDNIDYGNLLRLARSIEAGEDSLEFFIVHSNADHFERTMCELSNVWYSRPDVVKLAFSFIGSHQIAMWKSLSQEVFKYGQR